MTIMIHKQLPGHFNSIRYISMVSFFFHSFFFGIFPLCLRPWQSLACPTVHPLVHPTVHGTVRCRNLKVVLTVAKIEFLFNLYGFVRWPAPSSHLLIFPSPFPLPVAFMRTLYLVSWRYCPTPFPLNCFFRTSAAALGIYFILLPSTLLLRHYLALFWQLWNSQTSCCMCVVEGPGGRGVLAGKWLLCSLSCS